MAEEIYLIDGSAFIYRAFHAVAPLTNAEGFQTNAVFGFVSMLNKLLKDKTPTHLAVAFDSRGKVFRHEMYADYKANRPPMPDELAAQMPYIKEVVKALGLTSFEQAGIEADDIIGTAAQALGGEGKKVVIVSGDKDLAQLLEPGVRIYNLAKDDWWDAAGTPARMGVRADQILDLLALIRAQAGEGLVAARRPAAGAARTRCVMVVDDSITVRQVTQRLLNRNGIEVTTIEAGQHGYTENLEAVALVLGGCLHDRLVTVHGNEGSAAILELPHGRPDGRRNVEELLEFLDGEQSAQPRDQPGDDQRPDHPAEVLGLPIGVPQHEQCDKDTAHERRDQDAAHQVVRPAHAQLDDGRRRRGHAARLDSTLITLALVTSHDHVATRPSFFYIPSLSKALGQ